MTDTITFTLDGRELEAAPGETIWQVGAAPGRKYLLMTVGKALDA